MEGRFESWWGGGGGRIEFKGGKTHISKLAYKCMKHENMQSIDFKKWYSSIGNY
jgi:hypothetical protein